MINHKVLITIADTYVSSNTDKVGGKDSDLFRAMYYIVNLCEEAFDIQHFSPSFRTVFEQFYHEEI